MTAWERVRTAILAHDRAQVRSIVTGLTDAERREVVRELPAFQRERRDAAEWRLIHQDERAALRMAGMGCAGGPAAAAGWLFRRGLEVWWGETPGPEVELVQVVAHRPVEWRVDLARRVAARLPSRGDTSAGASNWRFAALVLREAGAEPPSDDGFVLGWVRQLGRLCDDPFLDVLAPMLFETDGVGRLLEFTSTAGEGPWERQLCALAAAGRLNRETLLDGCLRRFLRGGPPPDLRWFVRLHDLLAPTPEETRERARDYLRLLPAAPPAVAEVALRTVRSIDEAGGLDEAAFAEAAEAVLFRPEKKLVRAALSWLGRTGTRRVDTTLAALTVAFGQEALDLRAHAVKLIVKLAPRAGDDALRTVREAATGLPADLRSRIADACGAVASVDAPREPVGVPPYVPRPLPAPIGSVAELAEETARLFGTLEIGTVEGERLLAGLVHFAYHAPEDTRGALARVPDAVRWSEWVLRQARPVWRHPAHWLGHVVGVFLRGPERDGTRRVLGRVVGTLRPTAAPDHRHGPVPDEVLSRRFAEVARLIGRTPLLLSTPTSVNSQVDPAELVGRLERLEEAGLSPGDADLEQALLRLPRTIDPAVAVRARKLSSPAGRTVADALSSGVLPDPRVVTEALTLPKRTFPNHLSHKIEYVQVALVLARVQAEGSRGTAAKLCRLPADGDRWKAAPEHTYLGPGEWWPSVLPSHREVIAAHMLPTMADATEYATEMGAVLIGLAEADGPAGDALATVLAYRLAAHSAEERSVAVDALLILAGRGGFPATELGVALGRLAAGRLIKLNRVVSALTDTTDAGAASEVWTALSTALPHILPRDGERARPGVPDLLALATRCAEATGARSAPPELAALASRGGSSRLVQEAARLHRVITR